jgi:hypothetical protein
MKYEEEQKLFDKDVFNKFLSNASFPKTVGGTQKYKDMRPPKNKRMQ